MRFGSCIAVRGQRDEAHEEEEEVAVHGGCLRQSEMLMQPSLLVSISNKIFNLALHEGWFLAV